MDAPCQVLVMTSGNGSNFQALCDGVADGRIANAALCRLVVNRAKAFATTRAKRHGIPWEYLNLVAHGFQARGESDAERLRKARMDYDAVLAARVLACAPRPQLIILAGWMHVLGEAFLRPVAAAGIRVINLHPALPGRYDGARAIERAWDDFCAGRLEGNVTGVMVHHVVAEVDRGEPIATREVACLPDDDLSSLTARIHAHEHELIVEATAKMVAEIVAAQRERGGGRPVGYSGQEEGGGGGTGKGRGRGVYKVRVRASEDGDR